MTEVDKKRAKKIDPLMPATRFKLAILFVGKDVPSRSSEFAHPDVIIGLSVTAYRYEGLRYTDFVDVIAELRSEAIKEIIPWPERKAVKRYNKWVEDAGGVIRDIHKYTSLEEQFDDVKMDGDEDQLQCTDYIPDFEDEWVDANGISCEDYEKDPLSICVLFGSTSENFGLTATQICCACYGGDLCDRTCKVHLVVDICNEDRGSTV